MIKVILSCALIANLMTAVVAQSNKPAATDLWDITQGTVITSRNSTFWNERALLGENGHDFAPENTYMYFGDGSPEPFVHTMDWKTENPVIVEKIRLFAVGDYPDTFREFSSITIKAKSVGSAVFDQTLVTFSPSHPYTFFDRSEWLLFDKPVTATAAREFRAELIAYSGAPRLRELDAFGTIVPPPGLSIQSHPSSTNVIAGGTATFSVQATGEGELSYQWFYNGTPLPGAKNATLAIVDVQPSHSGEYYVRVSDVKSSLDSQKALLKVTSATPQPSTDDLFDISKGSVVVASSPIWGSFESAAMFGGESPSPETGSTVFADGAEEGSVHWIEWKTATPILLEEIKLYASGDPAIYLHEREFSKFVLKAKSSPESSSYDVIVYSFETRHPYTWVDEPSRLLVNTLVSPVTAQHYRAEFTQWNAGRGYDGPRIIELDGFGKAQGIQNSTIADWTLEEGTVGSVAARVQDHSGNGNDGKTIIGSPQFVASDSSTAGNVSISFPPGSGGLGSAFRADDSVDFNLGPEFTLEVSLNPGSQNNEANRGVLVGQDATSGRLAYGIDYRGETRTANFLIVDAHGQADWVPASIPNDGKSHHLAGVLKDQTLHIYLDKTLVNSKRTTLGIGIPAGGKGRLTVGANDIGGYWFHGVVDRARISRKALAPEEFFPHAKDSTAPVVILRGLVSQTVEAGANVQFQVLASGGGTLSYAWTHNGNPISNATFDRLTLNEVTVEQSGTYAVTISNGSSSATSTATLTVKASGGTGPVISSQPRSVTIPVGGSATFDVVASGALAYQWYFNGAEIPNATGFRHTIVNAQLSDAGTYTVSVGNASGVTESQGAVLEVIPATTGGEVYFANRIVGQIDAPVTDPSGKRLEGSAFLAQLYAGASAETLGPVGAAVPFRSDAQAGYFVPGSRIVPGINPGQTAVLQVRAWASAAGTTFEAARANGGLHGQSETISLMLGGGVIIPPNMDGLKPFSVVARPHIARQPQGQSVYVGDAINLMVEASGSGTLSYQWFLGETAIEGATSASYSITAAKLSDAGSYTVRVSNSLGAVTSNPAVVEVKVPDTTPPTVAITSPVAGPTSVERVVLAGTASDNVGIARAFWERNGQQVGPLTVVDGQFQISNLVLARGENVFRVVVVDAAGNEASASVLVVLEASRILTLVDPVAVREGSRVSVPVELVSKGDVGAMTFVISYNPEYLAQPELVWSEAVSGAFIQVNTGTPGEVRAAFALPGVALGSGRQSIATLNFHVRSIPESLKVPLGLRVVGVYSALGDPITSGTDSDSALLDLVRRTHVGDNNANDRLDVGDASIVMRLVTLLDPVRAWDITGNDLNKNTELDAGDVIRVLRAVVELDPQPGEGRQSATLLSREAVGPVFNLTLDQTTGQAGQKIKAVVALSGNNSALAGASFALNYDTNALRLDSTASYKAGTLVPGGAVTIWNVAPAQNNFETQSGRVNVAMSSPTAWSGREGELAVFTFTVQSTAANRFKWPITVTRGEISSGFQNTLLADAQAAFYGRDAEASLLTASINAAGQVEITVDGEIGVRYRIEASQDLKTWTEISVQENTTGVITLNDPASLENSLRFYRAIQLAE